MKDSPEVTALLAENDRLRALLGASLEDTARIDWLEDTGATVSRETEESMACMKITVPLPIEKDFPPQFTVRSCLDAARKSTPCWTTTSRKPNWTRSTAGSRTETGTGTARSTRLIRPRTLTNGTRGRTARVPVGVATAWRTGGVAIIILAPDEEALTVVLNRLFDGERVGVDPAKFQKARLVSVLLLPNERPPRTAR